MKVVCAWCQKSLPEKAPLADQSVSHGICPKCAKAFEEKIPKVDVSKNPQASMFWTVTVGTRQDPRVLDRLVGWVVHQTIQREARSWRLLQGASKMSEHFSVGTFKTLDAAKARANGEIRSLLRNNPGAAWHGMKELEADQQDRHAKKKAHKDFFHGKSIAHLESGLAARAMKMNPLAVFTVGNPKRRPLKYRSLQAIKDVGERHLVKLAYDQLKKPSRVAGRRGMPSTRTARKILKRHGFKEPEGNPPKRLNVGIAGVVYNRALEIRAEKTVYQPGLYKHPFDRKSQVEVLALDNGDLLLHSIVGVRLWGQA